MQADLTAATPERAPRRILLANPRGFCAGVDRAIEIVNKLLDIHEGPIYVRKEIVHNRDVVARFQARGVVFVEEVDDVPEGSLLVFSAHGISPEVRRVAADRRLHVIDATCPLVSKVHLEAIKFAKDGLFVLLVGHKHHDEVAGTLGEIPGRIGLVETVEEAATVEVPDPGRVAVVTQTTLSIDDTREIIEALRRRFPALVTPTKDDICYATQNRQEAVKALAAVTDLILVVGSENSSNSQRLRECAVQAGTPAHLIDEPGAVDPAWVADKHAIGVTAGASSPEYLVQAIVDRMLDLGDFAVEDFGRREPAIVFTPPRELANVRSAG
ncbi:MAG TPA: 4-hydroxy-3-methylbut-2-enyl diphosphate reductase [Candidatus Dormibacteraeota bacterium]|nr:4-hydroxy-3-methylbut-2-enyl diphosphate reductase [Candidatus Dormibacteraeota bacterium]